jgi:protein-S-isoprenylcysteine O-methyltransferase Ste14
LAGPLEGVAVWIPIVLWTLLFSLFLVLLLFPARKRDWRSAGIYEAFLIALFAEMFGFPLTLYVVTAVLGLPGPLGGSPEHPMAYFLGQNPAAMAATVVAAFALIGAGATLVVLGWREIYRGGDGLVVTGVYSRSQHPQYLGLILMTLGLLLWWPTILTIPMWPLLTWAWARLAKREERELEERFGEEYAEYRRSVGRFIPRRRRLRPAKGGPR